MSECTEACPHYRIAQARELKLVKARASRPGGPDHLWLRLYSRERARHLAEQRGCLCWRVFHCCGEATAWTRLIRGAGVSSTGGSSSAASGKKIRKRGEGWGEK